jgi:3-hydroxyacyl-CoA dehydrogenase
LSSTPAKAIGDGWIERFKNGDDTIPKDMLKRIELLERLVASGKLGVKTGQGIYNYR